MSYAHHSLPPLFSGAQMKREIQDAERFAPGRDFEHSTNADGAERGCRRIWTDGSSRDVTCSSNPSRTYKPCGWSTREVGESPPPEL